LSKRNLSEVSTAKLVELAIKLSESLAKDEDSVVFKGDGIKPDSFGHNWVT
jgi:hypothetical protein